VLQKRPFTLKVRKLLLGNGIKDMHFLSAPPDSWYGIIRAPEFMKYVHSV